MGIVMTVENFQEDFDNAVQALHHEVRQASLRIEREKLFGKILEAAAELKACYEPQPQPSLR